MTHYVIGIDPQEEAIGMGILRTFKGVYRLLDWSLVQKGFIEARQTLLITLDYHDIPLMYVQLAIEGQYFNWKKRNPAMFQKLIEARRDWECAALHIGIPCQVVAPKTWQSKMLGKGVRAQLDKLADMAFANRFAEDIGNRKIDKHVRDACLIGAYVIEAGKLLEQDE